MIYDKTGNPLQSYSSYTAGEVTRQTAQDEPQIRLPSPEEIKEWLTHTYPHLNPDYYPFFLMGVEALYTKLGGEKFIKIK